MHDFLGSWLWLGAPIMHGIFGLILLRHRRWGLELMPFGQALAS